MITRPVIDPRVPQINRDQEKHKLAIHGSSISTRMKWLADRRRLFLPAVRTPKVFKSPIDVAVDVPKGLVRDWEEEGWLFRAGSTIV